MLSALILVASTVVIIGSIAFTLAWVSWMGPKRRGEAWARSARELGMALEPFRRSAHAATPIYRRAPSTRQKIIGTRAGIAVQLGLRTERRGSGNSSVVFTYVDAAFARSLGMNLKLHKAGGPRRLFERVAGARDVQVGHPELDAAYVIGALEEGKVRRLLQAPYLAEALVEASSRSFQLTVEDHGLRVEVRRQRSDVQELSRLLNAATDLAARVVAAREQIGDRSAALDIPSVFRTVGQRRGLKHDGSVVAGRIDGMFVEARGALRQGRRETYFAVRFDRPLGVQLQLERQGTMSRAEAFFGAQDIETGDAGFDRRFVIKGKPEAAVRGLLGAQVRQQLTTPQEQFEALRVHDNAVEVRVGYSIDNADQLERGLLAMARLGAALTRSDLPPIGPFRS